MRQFLLILSFFLLFVSSAGAADLYKVTVQSQIDAEKLVSVGAEPIVAVRDGYLVLADPTAVTKLNQSGLATQLLAANVRRDELALDHRMDQFNVSRYQLVFSEEQLRLFKVDPGVLAQGTEATDVMPVPRLPIAITYRPSVVQEKISIDLARLKGVMEQVNQDSLTHYVQQLQAFYRRAAGTPNIYAARDTIVQRFHRFGYDDVTLDAFDFQVGSTTKPGFNVVAKKVGAVSPGCLCSSLRSL